MSPVAHTASRAWHNYGLIPALLLLLTLGLLLAGSTLAYPGFALSVGEAGVGRVLVRFYGIEQNASDHYRWSEPQAGLFLYGFEDRPALVGLRMAAPRPAGTPPVQVSLVGGGTALGTITVEQDWRRYQLLSPTRSAGETILVLATPAFTPQDDPRELGVVLSAASAWPAGGAKLPLVRALFLLAWPLLAWLSAVRLGWRRRWAILAGLAFALLAGWAAAFPGAAGYWLPTLGWPWWPILPLLLLAFAPSIKYGLGVARRWIHDRPLVSYGGLVASLVALLLLRLGLSPMLGMSILVGGVWLGLGIIHVDETKPEDRPGMRGGLLLLLIVLLALSLRLFNLDGQPAGLWRDESRHGLQALRIWNEADYRPIYVVEGADLPALLFYLMAPVVGLLGPHPWSARLVSALAGALTPLALYWAATPLIGRRAALFGASLLAVASWGLSMSRWAFPATLDHLLLLSAVGLLWRSLPDPAPERARQWPAWLATVGMALAGLLGGLAAYTYHTGRVAPLAMAAVVLLRLGKHPTAWRRAAPLLAISAVAGLLTIMPLALYILGDQEGYNRRVGNVGLLDSNDLTTHTPAGLLLSNLARYSLAYHVEGDRNGRHHLPGAPLLDPVAGLLFALGLAIAGARRKTGLAVPLVIGAIYLIPGLFSGNAPHAMRSLGTLAPACMLGGSALAALAAPQIRHKRATMLISLLLGASLLFNGWIYFGVMRVDPQVYGEFDLLETSLGRAVQAPTQVNDPALRAVTVYLPERLRGTDTVRFLSWGLPSQGYSGASIPGDGPVLLLLPAPLSPAAQEEALAALGAGASLLGPAASYPGTDEPITIAFGRGEAAARLFAELVAR